jgi:L-asparaginase/Glu-tRNA(Gln) amidotransferase subunit D
MILYLVPGSTADMVRAVEDGHCDGIVVPSPGIGPTPTVAPWHTRRE